MKVVILAGGLGTRLSEETNVLPKPMVDIGGRPLLWHIIKLYSHYGFNDFIICLGYKGEAIKHYFAHYYTNNADITFDMQNNTTQYHSKATEPWRVTLVDTGADTMTGGRLKRVQAYLDPKEPFCLTYGDGLSNVNIAHSVAFHKAHGRLATVTAAQKPERFGLLDLAPDNSVQSFREKPSHDSGFINAGFFVLSPRVLNYIADDATMWERQPLETLAQQNELRAFKHTGFWHCVDTLRDKQHANDLWHSGQAPWRVW